MDVAHVPATGTNRDTVAHVRIRPHTCELDGLYSQQVEGVFYNKNDFRVPAEACKAFGFANWQPSATVKRYGRTVSTPTTPTPTPTQKFNAVDFIKISVLPRLISYL